MSEKNSGTKLITLNKKLLPPTAFNFNDTSELSGFYR
jgi:hypothetical protein